MLNYGCPVELNQYSVNELEQWQRPAKTKQDSTRLDKTKGLKDNGDMRRLNKTQNEQG
eukprot:m.186295 g.186295  ORF g.186295 m.186295 type:complete len:58 (-) comp16919_c0_seq19:597-770(-)